MKRIIDSLPKEDGEGSTSSLTMSYIPCGSAGEGSSCPGGLLSNLAYKHLLKRNCFMNKKANVVKEKKARGTREWADFTANCIAGCENGCKYCYAQCRKIQLQTLTPENKNTPVERDWKKFITAFKGKHNKSVKKGAGPATLMFPSTHDITPQTLEYCLKALDFMLNHGGNKHNFLIVSKPRLDCVKRLCKELAPYKDRIMFRFTIGSADDAVLKFWEPYASSFGERVECLKYAFDQGFQTSVSCEPMLDGNVNAVISSVYEYVTDTIWLGFVNDFENRLKCNGFKDQAHMAEAAKLKALQTETAASILYVKWGADKKIEWKDSIREILGLPNGKGSGK